jgi:tetratricopeptide (TPR) repeat protein/O-antigen ligase
MAKNINKQYEEFSDIKQAKGVFFTRKVIWTWLPLLYLLIADSFYLRTYDSAQIKITLLQMGGISLIGLWVSLLILEGRKAFRKEDFVLLAPFFAYLIYNVISFIHSPYKGPSIDDFLRYTLYMSVSLIVIREFSISAIEKLTKYLLIAAAIAILYGFVQLLDVNFFPAKGMGPGLDPFIWRGAFGKRVFSTYGNPNFFGNFLVIMLPIMLTQYLKKKSIYLIPLMALDLLCLYSTDTKGAWLGFGISAFIFSVFYGYFFMRETFKAWRVKFLLISAILPLCAFIMVAIYSYYRPNSVSFRVSTWLSSWELIESHPFVGNGVGGFKVLYPAFRRPIIFHIEGKHNTETDHSENEFIEQWLDNGIIGFGIFLWIIAFATMVSLRSLSVLTDNLKGARPPPIAYDLLGYTVAFLGMLSHNFVDVSMRFVSSGVFLGLLPGVIINLSRGNALWELHYKDKEHSEIEAKSRTNSVYNFFMWTAKILAVGAFIYFAFLVITEFSALQGPLRNNAPSGEELQWFLSWSILIGVIGFLTYSFIKIILEGFSLAVPLVLITMLFPLYYFWGYFKADINHNMAIFFSKQNKWEDAIKHYEKVNSLNPYFIMPYYFTGNVFNDRLDMKRQYRPEWGDINDEPRTDYERALGRYETVRKIAPNYVQMHHQVGLLYMKMSDYMNKQKKPKEAQKFLDMAQARFDLYHNLDPVFPFNYFRTAQIHIFRKEYKKAEEQYLHYINAPECHREGHKHETAQVYFNLGNLRYVTGNFSQAIKDYEKALELKPDFAPAQRNLKALKARRRVRGVAPTQAEIKRASGR